MAYVGGHLNLIHWARRFLHRLARTDADLALSVARCNGKSALCAAIGAAVIDGPLRISEAEVILVASSFQQAVIMFRDVRRYLGGALADRSTWRVRDTTNQAEIEHRPSRARLKAVGSDPRRMHGLRPLLVLADEPAQWPPSTSEASLAALPTGLGKHPGSRLIALGTRPRRRSPLVRPDAPGTGRHRVRCPSRRSPVPPSHLEAGQPVA